MRPCGVVNTVGGTRTTDRHLLPERTASLAGLSGKISIVSFCVTQVSSFFSFFLFWLEEETARNVETEREKRRNVVYCRGAFKFDEPFLFLISLRD